ncbi:hypothetical protein [Tropicimonas sp. S265A]|uniref:hypothetical protein n=1 Tax=Tropicimonas sp. S265A TaxID=3415134 RepID=UPI003C7BA302
MAVTSGKKGMTKPYHILLHRSVMQCCIAALVAGEEAMRRFFQRICCENWRVLDEMSRF